MSIERELKLRLEDRASLRARLEELGGERAHHETLEDNLVWDRAGELVDRGCLLRLRTDGQGSHLTYKGPATFEEGVKAREELETGVADADALAAVLRALGYEVTRRYQKYRETWRLGGCLVALDRTPMGDFVEFEGSEAVAVARRCGLDPEAALADHYLALWQAFRRRRPQASRDMIFDGELEDG